MQEITEESLPLTLRVSPAGWVLILFGSIAVIIYGLDREGSEQWLWIGFGVLLPLPLIGLRTTLTAKGISTHYLFGQRYLKWNQVKGSQTYSARFGIGPPTTMLRGQSGYVMISTLFGRVNYERAMAYARQRTGLPLNE